jgi:hypothetical protein
VVDIFLYQKLTATRPLAGTVKLNGTLHLAVVRKHPVCPDRVCPDVAIETTLLFALSVRLPLLPKLPLFKVGFAGSNLYHINGCTDIVMIYAYIYIYIYHEKFCIENIFLNLL